MTFAPHAILIGLAFSPLSPFLARGATAAPARMAAKRRLLTQPPTGEGLHKLHLTTSGRDRDFLQAMAEDSGPSSTTGIGKRTGMRPNAVGNYRTRLVDAGLIEPAGHGLVDFAIPGLREYLTPRYQHSRTGAS